ncbi:MAG TPA: alpha/beta hydrolase [Thermoleophilaceae bacterium]|jgi:pimeloyl-ACP methyl ester carboxylesterase
MKTLESADGTQIAYDDLGDGPPVIMIVGAFNDRATTAPLAEALASDCRVLNYDRRGRGDSGDNPPYAIERELEDLEALIAAGGGSASLFGYSSGGYLAMHAAAGGLRVDRLALYEPPLLVDDSRPRPPADLAQRVDELVSSGRRGDAVELYQREAIGLPQEVVVQMRKAPFRPGLERIAHTLVYDALLCGDISMPHELVAAIDVPALVIDGGESWGFLRSGAKALAEALPDGRQCTLEGESHNINPEATAPVLASFLAS